ncbi:MAG: AgmX/PglI C-terminal domain-containing protein [Gammaproteobacteria bacterium]
MAVHYHSPDLPWAMTTQDEHRFRVILASVLIGFLVISSIITFIQVPKITREQAEEVPPRLARLVLERKQLPPPVAKPSPVKPLATKPEQAPKPQPAPKAELRIKPQPEKKIEPVQVTKQEPTPEPLPVEPPKVNIEAARKKAASSGLLALSNDLAALRDKPVVTSAQTDEKLIQPSKIEPFVQRSMITSGTARGNEGVKTASASRNVSGTQLAERTTTRVNNPQPTAHPGETEAPKSTKQKTGGSRTDDEIQLVFDKNKGALYSLYNRALRQDPSLQGKVVLKLTIEPSGKVSACEVVSSAMEAPELIQKIVARVLLFDFGAKEVATTVTKLPIDFLPSS